MEGKREVSCVACGANNKMNVMELNGSKSKTSRLTPVQFTHTHNLFNVSCLHNSAQKSFLHFSISHFFVRVASEDGLGQVEPLERDEAKNPGR